MSSGSKRINLMFYIASLYHGGAERVIASLCKNLDPTRYAITVCWRNANGSIGEEISKRGFSVIGLPEIEPNVSPYGRFLALRRLLRDLQIDVIHTHDTGSLADAVQCRWLGGKVKIVHTFHFGNYPNLKRRYLWMERTFCRFADCLVAVGYEQATSIRRSLRLAEPDLFILYNGVESVAADNSIERNLAISDLATDDVVIGSVSTLTTQKGLFVLLDAAQILNDRGVRCKVVVAGGGPLQAALERVVKQRQLGSMVRFLGWVDKAAEALLPSLDIFCQSSLWEANSIVLLEAMAAGMPIVTTDVGESRHVIDHGRTGLVVEPGNALDLADALTRLVCGPSERDQMGKLAKLAFEERFTVAEMAGNYESIYEGVISH